MTPTVLARYHLSHLLFAAAALAAHGAQSQALAPAASAGFAAPAFTDPERAARVEALLPEIDKMYAELAAREHLPGLAYGIVLDGKLIHSGGLGFANLEQHTPAGAGSQFRIASMTKSFVAMAVMKLRDEGKLKLDDPVAKYLPEFGKLRRPTADSPVITIRHLMTMTTGLPEDNPWGDRQMELSNAALGKFVGGGLSFSNATGQTFEYSNLGFVMLGKVVSTVSGMRFQDYISKRILQPLGMKDTGWEYARMPADKLALGYRWTGSAWEREPMLHDGDAAAMGGLITTIDDFARYVAFHLSAWPARDGADDGPVKRASLREMQGPHAFSGIMSKATLEDGATPNPTVAFYGYGMRWDRDSHDVVGVGHSGGLPGFGSLYRFAPEYGVGVIAFSNLRYAPVYLPTAKLLNTLIEKAQLPPRTVTPSAILTTRQGQVVNLIRSWDAGLAAAITADNFFLDRSRADWMEFAGKQLGAIGKVTAIGALKAENQLRGSFPIVGEQGTLDVAFTLTPEREPKVQALSLKPAAKP